MRNILRIIAVNRTMKIMQSYLISSTVHHNFKDEKGSSSSRTACLPIVHVKTLKVHKRGSYCTEVHTDHLVPYAKFAPRDTSLEG